MNDIELRIDLIKHFELFNELSDSIVKEIVLKMSLVTATAGQLIFEEGDKADRFYLILSGRINITAESKQGDEIKLAELQKNDYFGEMSIIIGSTRTASARAIENTELYYLMKPDFEILLNKHLSIALALNKMLSRRLYQTNQIITDKSTNLSIVLLITPTMHRLIDHFIEYFKFISDKPVFIIEEQAKRLITSQIINENNGHNLILLTKRNQNVESTAHAIINFQGTESKHFCISATDSIKTIEYIVRKICNKTIGLALSTGLASGLSHIGVLKTLLKHSIPIDYIAGTSGGALYSALFAFGRPYTEIYETFSKIYKQTQWELLLGVFGRDFAFNKTGLSHGARILKGTIQKVIGDANIENSIIPYAAVSTDLFTGKEQIITKGSIIQAIRASISIPILFTPVQRGDQLLVDGVVSTPVPVSALEQAKIDIKIAVYVSELPLLKIQRPNALATFLRARNISADKIADQSMERAEINIRPEVSQFGTMDYNRIDEIIAAGEEATLKALSRIQKFYRGRK